MKAAGEEVGKYAKAPRISLVNQKSGLLPFGFSSYYNSSDVLGWS